MQNEIFPIDKKCHIWTKGHKDFQFSIQKKFIIFNQNLWIQFGLNASRNSNEFLMQNCLFFAAIAIFCILQSLVLTNRKRCFKTQRVAKTDQEIDEWADVLENETESSESPLAFSKPGRNIAD